MYIPFSNSYGHLLLTDEVLSKISRAQNPQEQQLIFMDYISESECISPYELYGLVFQRICDYDEVDFDIGALILDFVVNNRSKWDPDELAYFLLEVADDHSVYHSVTSWLKKSGLQEMINFPYAGDYILNLFWNGHWWILDLVNYFHWNERFAEMLDRESGGDENSSYYVAARLVEQGVLDVSPDECLVCSELAEAFKHIEAGNYYYAIPVLNKFHDLYPSVMRQRILYLLALSYLQIDWRGIALHWASKLEGSPKTDALRDEITAPLDSAKSYIQDEFKDTFSFLKPDSMRVLVNAEFMYRYSGMLMSEYGALITTYARVIETHLKKVILPQLRDCIGKFGLANNNGERYILYEDAKGKRCKLRADVDTRNFSLGKWGLLFGADNYSAMRGIEGYFYNCLHKQFGVTIQYSKFVEFGKRVTELSSIRNKAAHGMIKKWSVVKRVREIVVEENILSWLRTTRGPLS